MEEHDYVKTNLRLFFSIFLVLTFLRPANIGQSAEVDWDARTIFDKYAPIVSLWHRDSWYDFDYSVPAFNTMLHEWRTDYPNALALGDLAWTESNPLFAKYRPHFEPPPGEFTAEMVEFAALMAFMDTLMSVEPDFKADRFVLSNMKHFMTFSKLLEFQGEQSEPEFLNELMDAGWADHFVGYLIWLNRGMPSLAPYEDNKDYSRWYEKPKYLKGSEQDPSLTELFAAELEEETIEERQLLAGMAKGAKEVGVEIGNFMGDLMLATAVVTSSEGDAHLIVLWADEGGWRGSQITNVHAMRQGQAGQDAVLIATTVDLPKAIFSGIPAGLEEARERYEIGEHKEAGRQYMRTIRPPVLFANGIIRTAPARAGGVRSSKWVGRGSTKNASKTPDFISNVTVKSFGKVIWRGVVDIRGTLQNIRTGKITPRGVFRNREGLLPKKPEGYYHEYVHPTIGVRGVGPQRIILGKSGELF